MNKLTQCLFFKIYFLVVFYFYFLEHKNQVDVRLFSSFILLNHSKIFLSFETKLIVDNLNMTFTFEVEF